jgi:DNA replication protein DnaC
MINTLTVTDELKQLLKTLHLPTVRDNCIEVAEKYEKENKSHLEYLLDLSHREVESRYQKRMERLLKDAKLPRAKLLNDFDVARIPGLSPTQILRLSQGDFIDRCENVLLFGNPGTGKSHLCIALAREWCLLGRKVLYISAANLVQQLLQAKQALALDCYIKKLDRCEVLIIDDISYVPFERHETDVLFLLLAQRYEMRSVMITSNLAFAGWGSIFKDETTTAAVIDRLVHHATILELNAPSYRAECASKAQQPADNILKKEEENVVKA